MTILCISRFTYENNVTARTRSLFVIADVLKCVVCLFDRARALRLALLTNAPKSGTWSRFAGNDPLQTP